jgi:glutamate synthase domain-containing protein 3
MVRQCHLNTCPVGIATQREDLRRKFPGQPEHIMALLLFVGEQVRMILAEMGARSLAEIIGRVDLLEARADLKLPKARDVDLSALLTDADPAGSTPRTQVWSHNNRPETEAPLDEQVWQACQASVESATPLAASYEITNRDRSVGARLAGEIGRRWRDQGLPGDSLALTFTGCAGQSFGAFCHHGMRLKLIGEAQDFVGKSMFGGQIILVPPPDSPIARRDDRVMMGNTVLYGATGGQLFAAGQAGERLGVRNSGATFVVEGCGDHGCEYMTGGIAVMLGPTGRNFGAGMTGGVAYLLDAHGVLHDQVNSDSVDAEVLDDPLDVSLLLTLIRRHHAWTQSVRAARIIAQWPQFASRFRVVVSRAANETLRGRLQEFKKNALAALTDEPAKHAGDKHHDQEAQSL